MGESTVGRRGFLASAAAALGLAPLLTRMHQSGAPIVERSTFTEHYTLNAPPSGAVLVEDHASIAKYGRRWMRVSEATINTEEEARRFAESILQENRFAFEDERRYHVDHRGRFVVESDGELGKRCDFRNAVEVPYGPSYLSPNEPWISKPWDGEPLTEASLRSRIDAIRDHDRRIRVRELPAGLRDNLLNGRWT